MHLFLGFETPNIPLNAPMTFSISLLPVKDIANNNLGGSISGVSIDSEHIFMHFQPLKQERIYLGVLTRKPILNTPMPAALRQKFCPSAQNQSLVAFLTF